MVLLLLLSTPVPAGERVRHFVILLYHHVSEATPASTSVTPDQFEAHLDWLAENGYQVWSLSRALHAVFEGEGLPDRVVAMTFDDAYESVHAEAWPRLAARDWTASVYVNTDAIDQRQSPYMSWDQIRDLARSGFEIGNHSATHLHAGRLQPGENETSWRNRVLSDFERARERIIEEIGSPPARIAWPYGEDVPELTAALAEVYAYGLAQRSGAVGRESDSMALPRFPMARQRAGVDRLELAVRTRPLTLHDAETRPPRRRGMVSGPRALTFRVPDAAARSSSLRCFLASGQALDIQPGSGSEERIRIDLPQIEAAGRHKINCTQPAADGSGDFHWGSFQWIQPPAAGQRWPD